VRIREIQEDNKEGFVVRFESGFRVKVKFEEYVRLHRIVTQVSSYTIWEFLKDQKSMEALLDRVPDEFYKWVKLVCLQLEDQFNKIEKKAKSEFKYFESRKEAAEYFSTCSYPAILFRMLDKRPYEDIIWKMIKPSYERPFSDKEVL
jgi:RNA ligase